MMPVAFVLSAGGGKGEIKLAKNSLPKYKYHNLIDLCMSIFNPFVLYLVLKKLEEEGLAKLSLPQSVVDTLTQLPSGSCKIMRSC